MRHIMICISGWAGSGKDECAGALVSNHQATHIGFADPAKRHMQDTYKFTDDQLWGPSKFRNKGDIRYPKAPESNLKEKGDPNFWLSPREALQKYMELMDDLYTGTWVRKGIENLCILASGGHTYTRSDGILKCTQVFNNVDIQSKTFISCTSDMRHIHDHKLVRELSKNSYTSVIVRVKRASISKPPFDHKSETEQTRIRDEAYDFVIDNNSSLEHLHQSMSNIVEVCSNPGWIGKSWKEEYVLPEIQETYQP